MAGRLRGRVRRSERLNDGQRDGYEKIAPIISPKMRKAASKRMKRVADLQPWKSITQDVKKLVEDTPSMYNDTYDEERAVGSERIRRFLGLEVSDHNGYVLSMAAGSKATHRIMAEFADMSPEQIIAVDEMSRMMEGLYGAKIAQTKAWVSMSTGTAPALAPGVNVADNARKTLLANNTRVVVKAYNIGMIVEAKSSRTRKLMMEVINGITVSHGINDMIHGYSSVLSIHFATIVENFIAPGGPSGGAWASAVESVSSGSSSSSSSSNSDSSLWPASNSSRESSEEVYTTPAGSEPMPSSSLGAADLPSVLQVVVEEYAGAYEFFKADFQQRATASNYLALFFQLLHGLSAFQLSMGGVHFDLHAGNFRIDDMGRGTSIYRDATLAYSMPNVEGLYVLPPHVHGNFRAVIFDFGRARAWVPVASTGNDHGQTTLGADVHYHPVLMGIEDGDQEIEPNIETYGVSRRNPQWGRDVQTLGNSVLLYLDLAKLESSVKARGDAEEMAHFDAFVSLTGYMCHSRYVVDTLLDDVSSTKKSSATNTKAYKSLLGLKNEYIDKYPASCDTPGTPIHRKLTMKLSALIHDPKSGVGDLFTKRQYASIVCRYAPENLNTITVHSNQRAVFATPMDCLLLDTIWASLRHTDKNGPLPANTILAGHIKPSQVMLDPLRNDTSIEYDQIPESHRRFLPPREVLFPPGMERKTLPIAPTTPASSMMGAPLDGVSYRGSKLGAHSKCVFCERPATLELADHAGINVCSALCGQMHLLHTNTLASLHDISS